MPVRFFIALVQVACVIAVFLWAGPIAAMVALAIIGGDGWNARRRFRAAQAQTLQLFLDHRGNQEGGWLSAGQIIKGTHLSRKRVIRALYALSDEGWLEQERVNRADGVSMGVLEFFRHRLWYDKVDAAKKKLAS